MKLFNGSLLCNVLLQLSLTKLAVADEIEDQLLAKVYGVATKPTSLPRPSRYPEWVSGKGTVYNYKDPGDWTAGFFPGTLWLLYQRSANLSHPLKVASDELLSLARAWTAPLKGQKDRTDTHDLGFMIHDSWGWDARLLSGTEARGVVRDAANALAKRFNTKVGAIRSWGGISDTGSFTVIIDNMMNLEMLYWAAAEFGLPNLASIATTHATTTMRNHFRADGSTWHVLNYNQNTGAVTSKTTNQGYSDGSCWSRGQAWGAHGYVSAYKWTKNTAFLDTAKKAFDYFLSHLPADGVPYWDFQAPLPGPRDTSAAMIVASGLLYLVEVDPASKAKYLQPARKLIDDTLKLSQSDKAAFTTNPYKVTKIGFESILMNGTIDNNPSKQKTERSANTGIVYQGYYLAEAQNRLIAMGLV